MELSSYGLFNEVRDEMNDQGNIPSGKIRWSFFLS